MRIFSRAARAEYRIDDDDLYIYKNQLAYNGVDLLNTFPSVCIDCQATDKYKIWIQEVKGLGSVGNYGKEVIYWRRCINCIDTFELPFEDYNKISSIIKLNKKLSLGKIDELKHQVKVEVILQKLYKKVIKKHTI